MSNWSFDALIDATVPQEFIESAFDIHCFRLVLLSTLILSMTYPVVHRVLLKCDGYKKIEESNNQQMVILHHTVEALLLFCATPIFSYYMIRLNFQVHDDMVEVLYYMRSINILALTFMVMYLIEIASRFKNIRFLILFHHLLTIFDAMIVLFIPTVIMVKTAGVLVYFICFESLIFVGLLMYRLFPQNRFTPKVILAGMICFGASRPFQLLWIGAVVFQGWNQESVVKWQAIFQLVVTIVLTLLQIFSIKIHYALWKRCLAKQIRSDVENKLDDADSFTEGCAPAIKLNKSMHIMAGVF